MQSKQLTYFVSVYVSLKMMTCVTLSKKNNTKNAKLVRSRGLPDLELTFYGIKMNTKVPLGMPKIQITPSSKNT
jgi:hypothetical protein